MTRASNDVALDDVGLVVDVPARVERVVSIVPSLTESVAASAPGLLVGATDWCSHPAGLAVTRVRGTKNPDVPAIVALEPDVVLANAEENRAVDLDALRAAGIPVWVTYPRTVPGALEALDRMLRLACRLDRPAWLDAAARAWSAIEHTVPSAPRRRAAVPVWRRPWMAVGSDTFAGDVLARLGVENILGSSPERYPRFDPSDLPSHDLVVLPDEPYAFGAGDGPEVFAPTPCALVSGRHLTWYGPSLAEAPEILSAALARAGHDG
jgi:ABC-type Fe3+-hydroxamate transport system substrate-binding protein